MILVVAPLPQEAQYLKSADLNPARVRIEIGGHGKIQFALRTQAFIAETKPDLVICAGSCGSLTEPVRPLDVVAAESTVEHDFKLRFVRRPLPAFPGDAASIAALKNYETLDFSLHFGIMASGDEDIVDTGRARELHAATQALAVAWEGAGGARACLHLGVPFLELRGVTDSADHASLDHFRANLEPAMANVAAVIRHLCG